MTLPAPTAACPTNNLNPELKSSCCCCGNLPRDSLLGTTPVHRHESSCTNVHPSQASRQPLIWASSRCRMHRHAQPPARAAHHRSVLAQKTTRSAHRCKHGQTVPRSKCAHHPGGCGGPPQAGPKPPSSAAKAASRVRVPIRRRARLRTIVAFFWPEAGCWCVWGELNWAGRVAISKRARACKGCRCFHSISNADPSMHPGQCGRVYNNISNPCILHRRRPTAEEQPTDGSGMMRKFHAII